MKIGIAGYHGYMNLGDEVFLEVWRDLFSDHDVCAIQWGQDLSELDRVIIGGGDLLIPNLFTSAYWREAFLDKPTFVYGVGVPDFLHLNPETMAQYKAYLERCQYVALRDEVSAKFVREQVGFEDVHVVEDIAYAYETPGIKYRPFTKLTVGVSVRPNPRYNFVELIWLCRHIAARGFEILMIPLQPADPIWRDDEMHHRLKDQITTGIESAVVNVAPAELDVAHRWALIGACNYTVSMRMHGMVAALMQNTPCLALGDSNKFHRILEKYDLAQFGMQPLDGQDAFIDGFKKLIDPTTDYSKMGEINAHLVAKAREEMVAFRERVSG